MRGNSHVRFGGRAEETDPPKGRHRASARSNHTHGSLLIKEGVPVKVVSERLGHAHIAHTLQTYQHVLPGMQAAAADAAERITKPRPTLNKPGSNADPAAPPKRRSDAKKPTGNDPGERRGNNRRKAA